MMRDVVLRGTGRRAQALGREDLAGKTGTSNDNRDAWFSGFNGDLLATVWVGFDQERSLGPFEEGGRTALPIWIYFMEEALDGAPEAPSAAPAAYHFRPRLAGDRLAGPAGRGRRDLRIVQGRRPSRRHERNLLG